MTFKNFSREDIVSTKTLTHEAIPVTGSIISGSYNEENIKNYAHGMFQSVYDYPYLSASANKICDITVGYSPNSALSSSANVQNSKKINIYNQMAQVLVGYDSNGDILEFDQDGDIIAGGTKLRECFFINTNRLLVKDELKKGNMTIDLLTAGSVTGSLSSSVSFTDAGSANDFRVNSPAGEYGFLSASGTDAGFYPGTVGLVYYQAGVVVLTASVFNRVEEFGTFAVNNADVDTHLTDESISGSCDGFRARWGNFAFNNTMVVNSRIYNCRAGSREFNYSSNPTYLEDSRIITKNTFNDQPTTYITTVGLYSSDGVLLAVAKLSEPIKKTPATSPNIRVRLDF